MSPMRPSQFALEAGDADRERSDSAVGNPSDYVAGDTARRATTPEVKELRAEAAAQTEVVAELTLENRLHKKSMIGDGENNT